MKLLIISSLLFVLSACSMLPPSAKEFRKVMDREIGMNIKSDYFYNTKYKIIETRGNRRFYYTKSYNYSTKAECEVVYIVNMQDIIVGYKILTPRTCKIGISPVW